MALTASTGQAVKSSSTKDLQLGCGESEDAMDQNLPESTKPPPKPKAKAKKRRMVNELGNHNESPEPRSDDGSPEILLEGLHRTRAACQSLNYAVTNRAAPARRSLHVKALMTEALRVKNCKATKPGQKKDVKRKPEDDEDTEDELNDVEYVKTRSRKRKKSPQLEETDEETEEADDASNASVKDQQKRKASQTETTDEEMEEADYQAIRTPKRQKVLRLRPSRDEDSDQEDDAFLLAEANTDHETPSKKQPRRSSRIDCANATMNALGTNRSPPRLLTSGMAWDHKKGPMSCLAFRFE